MVANRLLDVGQGGQASPNTRVPAELSQDLDFRIFLYQCAPSMERNGDLIRAVHLMTTTEAAETLGVSRQRIHQMIRENKIDYFKYGSRYMLLRKDVESLNLKRERKVS